MRRYFVRPQSPWSEDHVLCPEIVAACVVREVMLAFDLGRFPTRRWGDWLVRRAHALYRVERKFRARMNGPNEREYCYTYMRHWLYVGLRKSGWKYADGLPPEMWSGYSPLGLTSTPRPQGRRRRRRAA